MSRIRQIILTEEERRALEAGYKHGKNHAFRKRCQLVLLKTEKRKSKEVAEIVGCCEVSVNNWLNRYEADGIAGLQTKEGRGRKSILREEDLAAVKKAVKANRQRLSLAKADLETELGKEFSEKTLGRYLKNMVDAINDSGNVPYTKPIKRSMR